MKFLVVDDDDSVRQFCVVVIENCCSDATVIEAINSVDAIEKLKIHGAMDLIICDFDMPGGNGDVLVNFLKDKTVRFNFILHTSNALENLNGIKEFIESSPTHRYIQKPGKLRTIEKVINELLSEQKLVLKDKRSNLDRDFRKVRIAYFWRYNKALCDIFLRLNREKYVKIVNANDQYSKDLIGKFVEKNQKYLYVHKDNFEAFSGKISSLPFFPFLEDDIDWNDPKKIEEMNRTTHAVLQDLILSAGITKNAIELANNYVEGIKHALGNKTHLTEMLFRAREKRDYIYDHSYMVACVASFIIKDLDWYSVQAAERICLAALFHDIFLKDPELAMLRERDEPPLKGFTYEETDRFLTHPEEMARLIRKSHVFPSDVDSIIAAHHENPEGTGFPKGLRPDYTTPLQCLFIIAHDFVSELYRADFDEKKHKDILTYIYNRYNSGPYKAIASAFSRTMELNSKIRLA